MANLDQHGVHEEQVKVTLIDLVAVLCILVGGVARVVQGGVRSLQEEGGQVVLTSRLLFT